MILSFSPSLLLHIHASPRVLILSCCVRRYDVSIRRERRKK